MFNVITIIIFFVGLLLCCIKEKDFGNCKLTAIKKLLICLSNKRFNEYLVNTMIAFLGVTIAITFANINTKKQNEQQTIYFLEKILRLEIETKFRYIFESMGIMDINSIISIEDSNGNILELEVNEDEQKFKPEEAFRTMKIYSVYTPSIDILLNQSPYNDTISAYTYNALSNYRANLNAQKIRIDNSSTIDEMVKHLSLVEIDLQNALNIIDIELEYQKKKISEDQVYYKIDELYKKLSEHENSLVK